jgi:tRNA modification GTPase
LKRRVQRCREELLHLLAVIEAMLDFGDEAPDIYPLEAGAQLRAQQAILKTLAETYRQGRLLREGALVVIAGRPNVGKSSLLNRLLAQERAIVTDIPGTTRDLIEETLDVGGVPVRLTDTAGLREARDPVEEMGVARTRQRLAQADLVLYLVDGSQPLAEDDARALADLAGRAALAVVNKADLPQAFTDAALQAATPLPALRLSALTGQGLEALKEAMLNIVLEGGPANARDIITQERHARHLQNCAACLQRAVQLLPTRRGGDAPWELAAQELHEAIRELGEITGEEVGEEILDRIFSQFCIGK